MAALGDVIAALVALFDAATSAKVFDGPKPETSGVKDYVLVGSTGEDEDSASADFALSDLGPGGWVDETGSVECSAWSWSGGTDIAAQRSAAVATFEACRDAVHADRTLGGALDLNELATVTGFRLRQAQTTEGAIARVLFTVTYQTVLTS
jgi:hypothetical protein